MNTHAEDQGPQMDPFSIESVAADAERIGRTVLYLPHATYPIHVRGLGGHSVVSARELRDDLDAALRYRPDAHGPLRARAARATRVFRRGVGYRYPLCCVARFAWDVLRGARPGDRRGSTGCLWVPCGVIHRKARQTPRGTT